MTPETSTDLHILLTEHDSWEPDLPRAEEDVEWEWAETEQP